MAIMLNQSELLAHWTDTLYGVIPTHVLVISEAHGSLCVVYFSCVATAAEDQLHQLGPQSLCLSVLDPFDASGRALNHDERLTLVLLAFFSMR